MGVIAGTDFRYRIEQGKNLYTVYREQGGEIPDVLKGGWNDLRQMSLAAIAYTNRKKPYLTEEQKAEKKQKEALLAAKKRPSKLKKKED